MIRLGLFLCSVLFAGLAGAAAQSVTPPRIAALPVNQTVNEGQKATLTPSVTGSAPFAYQWKKAGVDLPGATNATFAVEAARGADAGSYTVFVANSAGSVTFGPIVLTVIVAVAPVIESLSFPPVVYAGNSFSIALFVKGTAPFSYQWHKDGVPLPGETRAGFSRGAATAADVGTYRVSVTNAVATTTSAGGTIAVSFPPRPIIREHPASPTVTVGDPVTLSVSAVGARSGFTDDETGSDLDYQWRRNGTPLPGATTRSYGFIAGAATGVRDSYTVLVGNPQGVSLSEPAVVTVLPPAAPTITGHPAGLAVRQGEELALTVDAAGTRAPVYRWRKDGVLIAGATAATYAKPAAVTADAGSYTVVVSNPTGTVTSLPAPVVVLPAVPPVITSHPASSSLPPSNFLPYLSVGVLSPSGVTYQWRKDGLPIPGAAASRTFSLATPQPASPGSYTVTVTNAVGSVTSKPAVVTVDATPPLISFTAGGEVVAIGDFLRLDLLLSVDPATVQWRKDGVLVPGANGSSLVFPAVTAAQAGAYVATVTAAGQPPATSRPITVEILDLGVAPRIVRQPAAQTRAPAAPASFTVAAEGERPFAYQWRKDAVAIPGATDSTYVINAALAASAGDYSVVVTNRHGSVPSVAVPLAVNPPAPLTAPVILDQPASRVLFVGEAGGGLSVSVASGTGVTYRWQKDGAALPGATSFAYIVPAELTSAGRYRVVVSNPAGSTVSDEISVAVVDFPEAPHFTAHPAGQAVLPGTTVTMAAQATGFSRPRYQWRKDGVDLPGQTNPALLLPRVSATDAGTYTALAANAEGVVSSTAAVLTLREPAVGLPVFTTLPADAVVIPGGTVTLAAGAAANPVPTYQWFRGDQPLAGATALTLTLAEVTNAATYTVVATNARGSVASAPADVRLAPAIEFGSAPPARHVTAGAPVELAVAVQSPAALTYQWLKNGVAVPGATRATFGLAAAKPADAGTYTLVAAHRDGSLTSGPVVLAVAVSPFAGIYFGTFAGGDSCALSVGPDSEGALIGFLAGPQQAVIARGFVVQPDGAFAATGETASGQLASFYTGGISGTFGGGSVLGELAPAGVTFAGTLQPAAGLAANVAGYYRAVTVAAVLGEWHAIAAADGALLLVALDPAGARSAAGQVGANGAFSAVQPPFAYAGNLGVNGAVLTGTYSPTGGAAVAFAAPGPPAGRGRLANVSTRSLAGSGARTLIAGFAINGTAPQDVLVRASGPALALFGVPATLPNPRLQIFRGPTVLFESDDWSIGGSVPQLAAAAARLGAFPLGVGSLDAALLVRLEPGSYTAQVSSAAAAAGVALVEVYDASAADDDAPKLTNVSTRANVGTGGDILIVGVVVTGAAPKKLLIRGIGPALAAFDVSGPLASPRLQLYRGNQLLRENTGWSAGPDAALLAAAAAQVGAFALPAGTNDAALLQYLAPGNYTVQIAGVANTTGVALVEVYPVP